MDTENPGQMADFWQRALNAAGSGVVLLDTASQPPRISWVNEAFTQITGYRKEEVAGETLEVLEIEGEPSFDPALFREAARTNSLADEKRTPRRHRNLVRIHPHRCP